MYFNARKVSESGGEIRSLLFIDYTYLKINVSILSVTP